MRRIFFAQAARLCACLLALASSRCSAVHTPSYAAQPTQLRLLPDAILQSGQGSLSHHAPVQSDLGATGAVRTVRGRSCESGLQLPWGLLLQPPVPWGSSVGWGDSSYHTALAEALAQAEPGAVFYNISADVQHIVVMGVWRQQCLVLTASSAVPTAAGRPAGPAALPGPPVAPESASSAQ